MTEEVNFRYVVFKFMLREIYVRTQDKAAILANKCHEAISGKLDPTVVDNVRLLMLYRRILDRVSLIQSCIDNATVITAEGVITLVSIGSNIINENNLEAAAISLNEFPLPSWKPRIRSANLEPDQSYESAVDEATSAPVLEETPPVKGDRPNGD